MYWQFSKVCTVEVSRKKEEDEFSSKRTFPDKRLDRQVNELAKSRKNSVALSTHFCEWQE